MDKRTGEFVWFSGTRELALRHHVLSAQHGHHRRSTAVDHGLPVTDKIWGVQPRTGKMLWNYELSRRGLFATPLVVGDPNLLQPQRRERRRAANVMGGVAGTDGFGHRRPQPSQGTVERARNRRRIQRTGLDRWTNSTWSMTAARCGSLMPTKATPIVERKNASSTVGSVRRCSTPTERSM